MTPSEQAFAALLRDNRARLWRLCRLYSNSHEGARDLQQSILLQLWRSWPAFEGRAAASTWLYRVALNTAISGLRRDHGGLEETFQDALAPGPAPDEQADRERQLEALVSALKRLDEADRALMLLYLEDASYAEIADVLGVSRNAVGVRLHRLKQRLMNELGGSSEQEEDA